MTPDDIRSAIASNPQSQETRVYLVRQAVENDIAEEIPDEWTIDLYNVENDESDDDSDLIADEYKFADYFSGGVVETIPSMVEPQTDVIIAAHESGALSIRMSPDITPIAKFDLEAADRLIAMIQAVKDWEAYHTEDSQPPQETDPVTGISILSELQQTRLSPEEVFTLTIPGEEYPYEFIINDTHDLWLQGLTAMANAAETYGRQDVPQ
jgi:hypothetical protein